MICQHQVNTLLQGVKERNPLKVFLVELVHILQGMETMKIREEEVKLFHL
jgi:hypothetical protein